MFIILLENTQDRVSILKILMVRIGDKSKKINKLCLNFVDDIETKVPRVSRMGVTSFVIKEKGGI